MDKRSAVSKVKMSGFDFVPTPAQKRGKLASERDLAKMEWEPWIAEGEGLQPSNAALMHCGVPLRFAYGTMLKTKDELIAMHAKIDHGDVDKLMASWMETSEWLKSIVVMLDQAYLRTMASAAAHNAKGGKFPGVHDMRRKKRVHRAA
jgi:hypothetical protein